MYKLNVSGVSGGTHVSCSVELLLLPSKKSHCREFAGVPCSLSFVLVTDNSCIGSKTVLYTLCLGVQLSC